MGRLRVVSEPERPSAGSTVLPGLPLPEWARTQPDTWAGEQTSPRGASPLPMAWSVLPLPDTEPLPSDFRTLNSPLPAAADSESEIEAIEVEPVANDFRSRRIAFLRGRHRRMSA